MVHWYDTGNLPPKTPKNNSDIAKLFADAEQIVSRSSLDNWYAVYGSLGYQTAEDQVKKLWVARRYKQLLALIPDYLDVAESLHQRAEEHNKLCESLIVLRKIRSAINDAEILLSDQPGFIEPGRYSEWRDAHREALALDRTAIAKVAIRSELVASWHKLTRIDQTLLGDICRHNEVVSASIAGYAYGMTGQIEGRRMDGQQMQCVAMEVLNHLVIAGAGTGKTTTIIARIKYLLKTGQCKPKDILVLSYTRASANEMRERIKQETGGKKIDVSTFHQLGRRIITNCESNRPSICSQSLLEELIKKKVDSRELDRYVELTGQDRNSVIRLLTTVITLMKSKGYSLDDLEKRIQEGNPINKKSNMYVFQLLAPVYQAYQTHLTETNTMDFNDMIWRAIRLIQNGRYLHSYKYVIVDEYQDMSYAPDVLLHTTRQTNDFRLFCVGDDWQRERVVLVLRWDSLGITYIATQAIK